MCGRMTMTHPADAMARLFRAAPANDLPDSPTYNLCPTQKVGVVVPAGTQGQAMPAGTQGRAMLAGTHREAMTNGAPGTDPQQAARSYRPMRWGFIPHWYKAPNGGPLLINARAETIAEKPAFRGAVRDRRCLIPATGFYEWTKGEDGARLPWYFSRPSGDPLVFAGIWQNWGKDDPVATCAIVTIAASAWMAETHHREPIVVEPRDWATWLGESGDKAAPLMRAAPEGTYQRWRVDRAVNSNRSCGPDLIAPI